MDETIDIRSVRPDEWRRLRDVRLRSLADTPDAFGETLAQAHARPDTSWRRWIHHGWGRGPQLTLVADDGSSALRGIVVGVQEDEAPQVAYVYAMWVDPSVRRTGVGTRLIDGVASWARARGASCLRLGVATDNQTAIAMYRRRGLRPAPSGGYTLHEGSRVACMTMELVIDDNTRAGHPPGRMSSSGTASGERRRSQRRAR
ncbi:MAG: GNAT family N-acetyltransferase [Actinomycetota bacterium]